MDKGYSRQIALLILLLLVFAVPQEAFANSSGKTGSSSTGCGGGSCQLIGAAQFRLHCRGSLLPHNRR